MIDRGFSAKLQNWFDKPTRKPLVVRGARQVGKTHTIKQFAKDKHLVYLNLERSADRGLFADVKSAADSISDIEVYVKEKIIPGKTLLFIDEIQEAENAMSQLRFYYEECSDLHVVAAGSLLELRLNEGSIEVPVGRIQYGYMAGLTFDEFLTASGNAKAVEILKNFDQKTELHSTTHELLLESFREFTLIGGMPEVVANFLDGVSYVALRDVYESIFSSFVDDVQKYSSGVKTDHLSFLLERSPRHAGSLVSYNNFDESQFNSKQVSYAFRMLEFARILNLVRPSNSIALPAVENLKAKPKLILFDTGLVNHVAGLANEYSQASNLDHIYRGQIAEQAVGLSLWQQTDGTRNQLNYWTKFKAGTSSEVDFLLTLKGHLVPVEVKSGPVGKLRSLHEFIDHSEHKLAVKVTTSAFSMQTVETIKGTKFVLVNMPYYLVHRLVELLEEILVRSE